ncbi:unnamed protein product [Orchesella dallaii]|uniref:Uncharacterized protein n=1 Tax=Orchesella dallaii TaxID=48710 RepID=A0ABP1RU73_9HEXA
MSRLEGTDINYSDDFVLGQGATSIVYKGSYGINPAAIKRVMSEFVDVYKNELEIWQGMKKKTEADNVNIVTLFNWTAWEEAGGTISYYFAMELALCDLGSRVKHVKQLRDSNDGQFIVQQNKLPNFIYGASKGLHWIHKSRILHRDVKPGNVLIFKTSSGEEIAKLGDFGMSRKLSETSTGTNSAGRGTSDWMAPEALQAMNEDEPFYSTRCIDIFSLGMTSHYALSLGIHPFEYKSQFGRFIMTNILQDSVPPSKLDHPHYEADHLFQWMMNKEPSKRPKIIEVLHHPFFWSVKQKREFLVDLARCFDSKTDVDLGAIRKEVDEIYKKNLVDLKVPKSGNWLQKMGSKLETLFAKRKSSKGTKKYNGDSVMMLVELIRDKYMHFPDMVDELTKSDEYFGMGGSFSEEKFIYYFLTTFPELIIILFCSLFGKRKNPHLNTLRYNFYAHFVTVPVLFSL